MAVQRAFLLLLLILLLAGLVLVIRLARAEGRREREQGRAAWHRYLIRNRVLRDLGHLLWGPPRLPDLRDRSDGDARRD